MRLEGSGKGTHHLHLLHHLQCVIALVDCRVMVICSSQDL